VSACNQLAERKSVLLVIQLESSDSLRLSVWAIPRPVCGDGSASILNVPFCQMLSALKSPCSYPFASRRSTKPLVASLALSPPYRFPPPEPPAANTAKVSKHTRKTKRTLS